MRVSRCAITCGAASPSSVSLAALEVVRGMRFDFLAIAPV